MTWKRQPWPLGALAALVLGLAGGAGWAAVPGHAHALGHGQGVDGPVTGTVEIKAFGGEVRATIIYTNVSSRVVGIEKLEEGQAPLRAEFEIRYPNREAGGETPEGRTPSRTEPEVRAQWRQVPYTGPMAKRGPYTKADFLPLEPGRSHRREVRLDEHYGFPEGEHTYTATHTCITWNYATRRTRHRSLKPATFKYTR
jgi:hypothetical protein